MAVWKCGKCHVEMEEVDDIAVHHGDIDLPEAAGYRCPNCQVEFISSEYVANELRSAEEMLEGK
jgi:DNA-directed RNA polymerase subunit RPC12/RpoP